jgi:hypothetical protein
MPILRLSEAGIGFANDLKRRPLAQAIADHGRTSRKGQKPSAVGD